MKKSVLLVDFKNFKDAYVNLKQYLSNGMTINEIAYRYGLSIEKIIDILIRFDKDIPKIFEMIYSYYINKKKIDETYEFFELCGYGEQFIRTLYSAFNRIDNRLINEKSMDEVIDEIYANMPKTKSKTK